MPTPTCPKCKRAIPGEDINVANDVAYCRACNLSHPLSSLTHGAVLDLAVDLHRPPAGAWYTDDGMGPVVGATHRSLGTAIGALLFALFWNGIVSVFVLLVVASTLRHMGITLPRWFPAPDMADNSMGLGMTLFLWVFLTPFIAIGLMLAGAFFSALAGRTEVRLRPGDGIVFAGVGPVGWRRRFDPAAVRDVRIENKHWRDNDGDRRSKTQIVLETREGKSIKFGTMLTEERRKFVASALQRALKM